MANAAKKKSADTAQHVEATAILRADHKLVSDLFAQFEEAESDEQKKELVSQICLELAIHRLHLEVDHTNPRARHLYARLGFVGNDRSLLTRTLVDPPP